MNFDNLAFNACKSSTLYSKMIPGNICDLQKDFMTASVKLEGMTIPLTGVSLFSFDSLQQNIENLSIGQKVAVYIADENNAMAVPLYPLQKIEKSLSLDGQSLPIEFKNNDQSLKLVLQDIQSVLASLLRGTGIPTQGGLLAAIFDFEAQKKALALTEQIDQLLK